jgi:hypothetical protein
MLDAMATLTQILSQREVRGWRSFFSLFFSHRDVLVEDVNN